MASHEVPAIPSRPDAPLAIPSLSASGEDDEIQYGSILDNSFSQKIFAMMDHIPNGTSKRAAPNAEILNLSTANLTRLNEINGTSKINKTILNTFSFWRSNVSLLSGEDASELNEERRPQASSSFWFQNALEMWNKCSGERLDFCAFSCETVLWKTKSFEGVLEPRMPFIFPPFIFPTLQGSSIPTIIPSRSLGNPGRLPSQMLRSKNDSLPLSRIAAPSGRSRKSKYDLQVEEQKIGFAFYGSDDSDSLGGDSELSALTSRDIETFKIPWVIEDNLILALGSHSSVSSLQRSDISSDKINTSLPRIIPSLSMTAADQSAGSPQLESLIHTGANNNTLLQLRNTTLSDLPQRYVRKPKMDLPMILGNKIILSRPDSGSEENIISRDLVTSLGLTIKNSLAPQKEFRMGNNKVVKALGYIQISCSFARDQSPPLNCLFYVFSTLIAPLIMGMSFLQSTQTLTTNKHRLQARSTPFNSTLICASLNNPYYRLRCYTSPTFEPLDLNSSKTSIDLANADTGSEVDLISLAYCKRRGFSMEKVGSRDSRVQFADGSLAYLAGKVYLRVHLSTTGPPEFRLFYVLHDLTCDVLLGEDFLAEVNAFETYHDSFTILDDEDLAQVNTIVWLKTPERFLTRLGRAGNTAPEPLSIENATPYANKFSTGRLDTMKKRVEKFMRLDKSTAGDTGIEDDSLPSFEARMDERDAKENRRREKAEEEIKALPLGEQVASRQREAKLTNKFRVDKESLLNARRARRPGGS